MKATYGEVAIPGSRTMLDGSSQDDYIIEAREIFKAPITDSGEKKSAKGLLAVHEDKGTLVLKQSCTPEEEKQGLLTTVFLNGKLTKETNLQEIRERINKCV